MLLVRTIAVLALMCSQLSALYAADPPPLTTSYALGSVAGGTDTDLESSFDCGIALCTIRNTVTTRAADTTIFLTWSKPGSASVALNAAFPCLSLLCGWTWDFIGLLGIDPSDYTTIVGTADFTGSRVIQQPCLGFVCTPAPYYEFTDQNLGLAQDCGVECFILRQSQTSLARLGRRDEDPDQPDQPVDTPMVTFTQLADVRGPQAVRYTYNVLNASDEELVFGIFALGWSGVVAPHGIESLSFDVPHAQARFGSILATARFENGAELSGPFQVLMPVPVPLPAAWILFAAALVPLARRAQRR